MPDQYSEKSKLLKLMTETYGFSESQAEGLYFLFYGGFDAEILFNKLSTVDCVIKAIGVPPTGPP